MPFLIDVRKWLGHKGYSWKSLDEITIWMTEFHPALSHMSDHFSSKKEQKQTLTFNLFPLAKPFLKTKCFII